MLNPSKLFVLFLFLTLLFSCGKHNLLLPESQEEPALCFAEEIIDAGTPACLYRQSISITGAEDPDTRYAYRITTLFEDSKSPSATDPEGWLLFGDDIWTSQRELSREFSSPGGRLENLITAVKVKLKSADGSIEELESPFKSTRLIGTLIEAPFSDADEIGTGAEFLLREQIGDIYMDGLYAHHFMYRLNILNSDLEQLQTGEWHSSIDLPDIRKVLLNTQSTPALTINDANSYTQFESYVVSRTGIEQASPSSIYFRTIGNRRPKAILYDQAIVGFGQYHYGLFNDRYPQSFYDQIPTGVNKYLRMLWERGADLEAINSDDFKLHLRWGYSGQYGFVTSNGIILSNDIFSSELNWVLDDETGMNYGSHISAFCLRLDGNPFPVLPQFFGSEVVTDNQYLQWLRVPNLNDASRHGILEGLSNGNHFVELKVEDNQGVLSNTVSSTIRLVPHKTPAQRSGILIVDGTPHHLSYAPESFVDGFYQAVLPTQWGNITEYEMVTNNYDEYADLPASVIQDYRAIVIHQDNPSAYGYLDMMIDALDIYLADQGSVLISGTAGLKPELYSFSRPGTAVANFLHNRLGINDVNAVGILSASLNSNPFFINALGVNGMNDIPLNLSDPFNPIVNSRQGLSKITFFDPTLNLDWLYGLGCKPVDHPTYPPTQEQYDLYSSKYVSYKHSYNGGKVAVFGFPLSYMEEAAVATALEDIINEMLGTKTAQGRNK